jgi:hypothetical protein
VDCLLLGESTVPNCKIVTREKPPRLEWELHLRFAEYSGGLTPQKFLAITPGAGNARGTPRVLQQGLD